jgi:hypothetical protein
VTPVAPTTETSGTTAPSTAATGTGGAAVSGG